MVVVCLWSKFSQIIHVDGSVDAARDVSVINFELILADLAQLERASAKLSKNKSKVKHLSVY